jgi:hypothetical protein
MRLRLIDASMRLDTVRLLTALTLPCVSWALLLGL